VVAGEIGEFTRLDRRPQQFHRVEFGCVGPMLLTLRWSAR
jgi:hypothetical protein